MPTLPSGRRIEFSMDRFHAHLDRIGHSMAREIVKEINDPDDLLFVMDAVHFSLLEGDPYFAGYVVADWQTYAADWSTADRQALQAWLFSPSAREARADAIEYIRGLYLDCSGGLVSYPYLMAGDWRQAGMVEGTSLRQ